MDNFEINTNDCDRLIFLGRVHRMGNPEESVENVTIVKNVSRPEMFTSLEHSLSKIFNGASNESLAEFSDAMMVLTNRVCRRVIRQREKDSKELDDQLDEILKSVRESSNKTDITPEGEMKHPETLETKN